MPINWTEIRPFNNSQNNAFEELVCQLAREEDIEGKKEFYRVGAPDGGVEAYCILNNDDEYGWQAKYFFSMGTPQWKQLTESFKTALRTHSKLVKYYICIPLDRQDPRIENQKWFMDKWNEKAVEWTEYAHHQGREISFEYWGSSELIARLSREKHAGRLYFWFGMEEFSENWFINQVENNIQNLGTRYTPELNVHLELSDYFDGLTRNAAFRKTARDHFDIYFKSLNKTLDSLRRNEQFKGHVEKIEAVQQKLNKHYKDTQNPELNRINQNDIHSCIGDIRECLFQCERYIDSHKQSDKKINDSERYLLYELRHTTDASDEFIEFIASPIISLANLPVMFLTGEAGIGKSHLLADVAKKKLESNESTILLLGQHFNSDDSPWTQILQNVLRLGCNEREFLGALDAKAQSQGSRILVIIDAINEGRGRYFWPDHISGFISEFRNYEWLGLVFSVRSSYEPLLIPENLIQENKAVKIKHHGFRNVEYEAASFFFKQYKIELPGTPLLTPEFSNPLFLKLFCEGLEKAGLNRICKGYRGITRIIDFFLQTIDNNLSDPKQFEYPNGLNVVRKVINKLIEYKLEHDSLFIPYEKAHEIADMELSRYSNKKCFLDALMSRQNPLESEILPCTQNHWIRFYKILQTITLKTEKKLGIFLNQL